MRRETRRSRRRRIVHGIDVVLDRERHAVEWPERLATPALLVGPARRGAHFVRLEADEGMERRCRRAARQQCLG
jgi:hypothetical protein